MKKREVAQKLGISPQEFRGIVFDYLQNNQRTIAVAGDLQLLEAVAQISAREMNLPTIYILWILLCQPPRNVIVQEANQYNNLLGLVALAKEPPVLK